jgi:hypothetical protein
MDCGSGAMPEIRLPPSRGHAHPPEMSSQAKSRALTKIMKDQASFLRTKTQPSDDFGSGACLCACVPACAPACEEGGVRLIGLW